MKHYRLITFATNILSILVSFLLAYTTRFGWDISDDAFHNINDGLVLFMLLFSYLFIFVFYHPEVKNGFVGIFRRIKEALITNVLMAAIFTSGCYMTKVSSSVPRGFFVYFFVINAILFFIFSRIIDAFAKSHAKKHPRTIVIYTDNNDMKYVTNQIISHGDPNIVVSAVVQIKPDRKESLYLVKKTGKNFTFTESTSSAITYLTHHAIDNVIFSTVNTNSNRLRHIIDKLGDTGVSILITLDSFDIQNLNTDIAEFNEISVIHLSSHTFSEGELFAKRLLDIIGGFIGCIVCIIVGIIIGPIIFFTDHGPIIFRQTRIGKNGHEFTIYKFRSMYVDSEKKLTDLLEKNKMSSNVMIKIDNDPRITPIGHFIRKTSLDEFPQFFNVLKGDMSLVGYRPPVYTEYNEYKAYYKRRMMIKPGITGLWQTSGRSNITDFDEVLRLDNYYIDHWSVIFDLKILLKTIIVVFKHDGAE